MPQAVCLTVDFWLGNDLDYDHSDAPLNDTERASSGGGEVDNIALGERTPIVDANDDCAMRALVRDPHAGTEGQGLVRCGHCSWVHHFAVCRLIAETIIAGQTARGAFFRIANNAADK